MWVCMQQQQTRAGVEQAGTRAPTLHIRTMVVVEGCKCKWLSIFHLRDPMLSIAAGGGVAPPRARMM